MVDQEQVFAKCARRLIPFIFFLYLVNYIDRVNVGFAALTMNQDVGLSPSDFGFGAGIFFLGYLLFQMPANLILQKLGARRWVFWMLVIWGVISASNALIQGPYSYYGLRLFLGVAEAGLFPGMLLYMTFWFPNAWRGRFISSFMAAIPMANIVGGPLSTSILEMDGIFGLHGWQWMFVVEGLPATLLGIAAYFWLPDGPANASWLTDEEKSVIAKRLASEDRTEHSDLWPALRDPRVWAISLVLLGNQVGLYGVQLWMPQIIRSLGFSNFATGWVVAMPFVVGMIAMILWGRSSDRKNERIWHTAISLSVAAFGLIIASIAQSNAVMLFALTVSLAGTLSYNGPFFSLPATFLAGTAAAGGIGFINSVGSLGRFVGPWAVGILKEESGAYGSSMAVMASAMIMAAVIVLVLGRVMAAKRAHMQPKPGRAA